MTKRMLLVVISVLLLMQAAMPGFAEAETISETATLDASVVASMNEAYDSPLEQADTTTVTIESLNGAPLPTEQTLTFSSDEAAAQSFSIDYDQLGIYQYAITQTPGSHPSATSYDARKYLWTVYVLREDEQIVTVQVLKIEGKEYAEGDEKEDKAVFANKYAETHASVKKVWVDSINHAKDRPKTLSVTLLIDGEEADTFELTAEDEWQTVVTGLPVFNEGRQISYTWTEAAVKDYTLTENTSEGTDTTLTNTWTGFVPDDYAAPGPVFINVGDCLE